MSCGGYVSSISVISCPVMPLWRDSPTKDTFSPSSSNIFLSIHIYGFFVSPFPSMAINVFNESVQITMFLLDFLVQFVPANLNSQKPNTIWA
jgi:hypothetical protein